MIYAGLDLGTSIAKITVFDDTKTLFKLSQSYDSLRQTSKHVIDARQLLDTAESLIRKAAERAPKLMAVGITSFGECFVLLDDKDEILFESMLYTDPRGQFEALEIDKAIGTVRLGDITGQITHSMFSLPKIMYIKKHHPDVYQQVKRILLMQDFVVYGLTGVAQIDYSLAARTLCFDINSLKWSNEILNRVGINVDLLSKPVPTGTLAGSIKDKVKTKLGIINDIKIINVSHDQIAALTGALLEETNAAVDGMGTCECITPIFRKLPNPTPLIKGGYGLVPYLDRGTYVCYSLINTGGALLDWIIKEYFADLSQLGDGIFEKLNQHLTDQPTNVMILPHFAGAGTPYMDSEALGAIVNLHLGVSRYEIYQAALESLTYEAKMSLQHLSKGGVTVKKLYATGGGARNREWLQIRADIFGFPIHVLDNSDAGTLGSAMIIGTTIGVFNTLEQARSQMIKVIETIYPNKKKQHMYRQQYNKYRYLYRNLMKVR